MLDPNLRERRRAERAGPRPKQWISGNGGKIVQRGASRSFVFAGIPSTSARGGSTLEQRAAPTRGSPHSLALSHHLAGAVKC